MFPDIMRQPNLQDEIPFPPCRAAESRCTSHFQNNRCSVISCRTVLTRCWTERSNLGSIAFSGLDAAHIAMFQRSAVADCWGANLTPSTIATICLTLRYADLSTAWHCSSCSPRKCSSNDLNGSIVLIQQGQWVFHGTPEYANKGI